MYLLDTNHCSRAILGDSKILNSLKDREQDLVVTCAITQGELIDMAERPRQKSQKIRHRSSRKANQNQQPLNTTSNLITFNFPH